MLNQFKKLVVFIIFVSFPKNGLYTQSVICSTYCRCEVGTMICNGSIPYNLPKSVTVVYIYAVDFKTYQTSLPFNNTSWENVTHLEILPDEDMVGSELNHGSFFTLPHKSFYHLKSLEHIRFSSKHLTDMDHGVFIGLDSLKSLDLSSNGELDSFSLTKGFHQSNFSNLETCSLRKLGFLTLVLNNFDSSFLDIFKDSKLKHLDLSYIDNAVMNNLKFSQSFPMLKSISFEGSIGIGWVFILSFYQIASGPLGFRDSPTFLSLVDMNLNYVSIPSAFTDISDYDVPGTALITLPDNLRVLRIRGFLPSRQFPHFTVIAAEDDLVEVTLSIHQSKVNYVLSFPAISIFKLVSVDISGNGISFGKFDLKGNSRLKVLNISSNALFRMDPQVLSDSLELPDLEELYASDNKLERVPVDLFGRTLKLKIIDLSHNKIDRISFKIDHLKFLKILDLSYNNIKILDEWERHVLSNMTNKPTTKNGTSLLVNLTGNPIECSCSSIKFLEWILNQTGIIISKTVDCTFDGRRKIFDLHTIAELKESCKLPVLIIIGSSLAGVTFVLLIIVVLILVKRYRNRKRNHILQQRIQGYKQQKEDKEQFPPVFLSYSSENSDFVSQYISPILNKRLQDLLKVDTNCVALGDFCFALGKDVADEMIRCIEKSSVVVFCVSKEFCQSRWCKEEFSAAFNENKPIVLMFLEHVQEKNMPKLLRKLYNRQTRAKWTRNEFGEFVLTPDWDTFCDSLLKIIVQETNV